MADAPTLSVTMLGAGQEVGRSCCVLQYRGKTIVCDTGVHPAYSGMASLPFVDELDWSTVDAILITPSNSSGVLSAIKKARDKKISVFALDTETDPASAVDATFAFFAIFVG